MAASANALTCEGVHADEAGLHNTAHVCDTCRGQGGSAPQHAPHCVAHLAKAPPQRSEAQLAVTHQEQTHDGISTTHTTAQPKEQLVKASRGAHRLS